MNMLKAMNRQKNSLQGVRNFSKIISNHTPDVTVNRFVNRLRVKAELEIIQSLTMNMMLLWLVLEELGSE
jgi:hypothetical protein